MHSMQMCCLLEQEVHDSASFCTWIAPDWKRVCRMSWSAGCMASCRYPMPCFSKSLSRTSFTRSTNASMSLSWACMRATHVRSCHEHKPVPHVSLTPTCVTSCHICISELFLVVSCVEQAERYAQAVSSAFLHLDRRVRVCSRCSEPVQLVIAVSYAVQCANACSAPLHACLQHTAAHGWTTDTGWKLTADTGVKADLQELIPLAIS